MHSPPQQTSVHPLRQARIRFERGTIAIDPSLAQQLPHDGNVSPVWDRRSHSYRVPAYRFADLIAAIEALPITIEGDLRERWSDATRIRDARALELRSYQAQALASWNALSRRGTIVLPTGAGKTRVAIAAIFETGLPTAVLVPTRALAVAWVEELRRQFAARAQPSPSSTASSSRENAIAPMEPIGLVGDGQRRTERVTVLTFESAYRHMDTIGDRFGLLIVDEVHHFGSGARIEALEASAAIARLGLTATAPEPGSPAAERIGTFVGPVAFEIGFADLVGTHLAPVTMVRIPVRLDPDERAEYDTRMRPFLEMRRTFMRLYPGCDIVSLLRGLGRTAEGRRALRDRERAISLASFPKAKRRLLRSMLERLGSQAGAASTATSTATAATDGESENGDRAIVFTAFAENAYDVARDALIPVITGETPARERKEILDSFRDGRVRAIASARVLNEGIDVPEARIAIIVAGTLGAREHIQRIGRVLRPGPGKVAVVYELVTVNTADAWRSLARERGVAASQRGHRHNHSQNHQHQRQHQHTTPWQPHWQPPQA